MKLNLLQRLALLAVLGVALATAINYLTAKPQNATPAEQAASSQAQ